MLCFDYQKGSMKVEIHHLGEYVTVDCYPANNKYKLTDDTTYIEEYLENLLSKTKLKNYKTKVNFIGLNTLQIIVYTHGTGYGISNVNTISLGSLMFLVKQVSKLFILNNTTKTTQDVEKELDKVINKDELYALVERTVKVLNKLNHKLK